MNVLSLAALRFADELNPAMEDFQRNQEAAEDVFAFGMALVAVFLVFGLVATIFWIWGLIDAAKRPDHEWNAAGQNKVLWIVLMVVLGVLATFVYIFYPRPALKRVAGTVGAPGGYPQGGYNPGGYPQGPGY